MSYSVEYINCKICGADMPKFLGFRGNLEYEKAMLPPGEEHMVTNAVRCRKCGFVYANPLIILDPGDKAARYADPKNYASSVSWEDPLKVFDFNLNIIEKFRRQRQGRLLDIGSGKGEFLAAARKRGWEVFGLEPSKEFVSFAKERYNLDILNAGLEEGRFTPEYFDVVTLNMVLEHIEQPHKVVAEAERVLKNGGLLFLEVPNSESLLLKLIGIYYKLKGREWSAVLSPLHYPYHCYGYNNSSLEALLGLHGFKIVKLMACGIGLRGFRRRGEIGWFKWSALNLLSNFFGLIGAGDILITVGIKNDTNS